MFGKKFNLDLEALISQVVNGHGYLHYGYWESGHQGEFTVARVGLAQQHYFDKMVSVFPPGVQSILDVGSGTGSNALALVNRGYQVDCVCPSSHLNQIARAKLPPACQIHETRFEDYRESARYDLLLFSESFHYLDTRAALKQIDQIAKKGVVIFDYFIREGSSERKFIRHQAFKDAIAQELGDRFVISEDLDLTDKISPTFEALDQIKNRFLKPFVAQSLEDLRREHRLTNLLVRLLFKKPLQKLFRKSDRYTSFVQNYEYRLIRLDRVAGAPA